jgi:phage shock protein A
MRSLAALALVAAAFVGSSCSSDDSPNTFCENRAELDSAIQDLRDVDVVDDGVEALDSQLTVVLDDVDALKASATELAPEVDAVKTSIESLKTSVAAAATPVDKATALTGGLAAIESAWQALADASDADC